MSDDIRFDWHRAERTGVPEVVFAQSKSSQQLLSLTADAIASSKRVLMTRISLSNAQAIVNQFGTDVHFHEDSSTLIVGDQSTVQDRPIRYRVAIVAAGTSDKPLVAEIEQCLAFLGVQSSSFVDVGVAGLWRLTDIAPDLNEHALCIAVAGMEGALFSVLAGLVHGPVIACPSPVGYGVSEGGHSALNSALASCAPGIAVVNIDNGFGAAALAYKMLSLGDYLKPN